MEYRDHLTRDPAVRSGKVIIRSTRIAVMDVLGYMAGGDSVETLLEEFPQLTREDVLACLAYAADRDALVMVD
jgi:uncharacterized protein (DUF433 family)